MSPGDIPPAHRAATPTGFVALNEPRGKLGATHGKIRRNAIVLGLIAVAFYFGFIVMAVMRNSP